MKTPSSMPHHRYRPFARTPLPDRTWPEKQITHAPAWCSVDLRDGNQALANPMNQDQKTAMFELLVRLGFKDIEVGFPAASQTDFDFVRMLIEERRIPEDVTIQVLTQARPGIIARTFEAIHDAPRAIVHMYNSTSVAQRRVVFNLDRSGIQKIAVQAAEQMMNLRRQSGNPNLRFEYSPESFTQTEPDFAVEICRAVMDVWQPDKQNPCIINLPATVEVSTPNIYADRVEWFGRQFANRDAFILGVHTHNDRGTAVAAAELAVMAGAQRVDGALFGNGERTGNMDILTMAMNLFSQGIDPELDFSDMDAIAQVYTSCTGMVVPARHPYAGSLVYTAFSGSHQDAINKGLKALSASADDVWDVPYLPIDPHDVGRDYSAVIQINSQSGKGGVAYILEQNWGYVVPKAFQPAVSRAVQQRTEALMRALTPAEIRDCFLESFIRPEGRFTLSRLSFHEARDKGDEIAVEIEIIYEGQTQRSSGQGQGPLEALIRAMNEAQGFGISVSDYAEHALGKGSEAEAMAYIGLQWPDGRQSFGAGKSANILSASAQAVASAINRGLES